MIRLHRLIDRGRRHPLLGPLLVLLLVLLMALMMLHEGHESAGVDIGVLCIGIALLLMAVVMPVSIASSAIYAAAAVPARGPPADLFDTFVLGRDRPRNLPLRL